MVFMSSHLTMLENTSFHVVMKFCGSVYMYKKLNSHDKDTLIKFTYYLLYEVSKKNF